MREVEIDSYSWQLFDLSHFLGGFTRKMCPGPIMFLGIKRTKEKKIAVYIRRPFSKPSHAGITYERRRYGA
jgi:hypothetical protein